MSKNLITILILLIPVSIWINFYTYYKYGRSLIKRKKPIDRKTKDNK